jgi:hypothetical protein
MPCTTRLRRKVGSSKLDSNQESDENKEVTKWEF